MEFIKRVPKIFVLSGKAGSGKTETSKLIEKYYKEKKCITISFAYYLKDYIKRITGWDGSEETKPRDFLQDIGIKLIKNNIDHRFLINRILQDIAVFSYFYDIIIISDARLVDEIESIKNNHPNSISIRINNKNENNLTKVQKKHITETELDNYDDFDYIINNDYNNLKEEIENILRSVEYE